MKLKMFRATHRSSSSRAQNYTSSLWFCIRERLLDFEVARQRPGNSTSNNRLMMGGVSPEIFWASYKHGIINFDILLHLVGYFCMKICYDARIHEHQVHSVLLHFFLNMLTVKCFMILILCVFLHSINQPKTALSKIQVIKYKHNKNQTPTRFGIAVPSSGILGLYSFVTVDSEDSTLWRNA
jgi:hypothetical protein